MIFNAVVPVQHCPLLRKPSGRPSRRYPTPVLYVQLRCTHGSSGHSGSTSGLLVLANTAPPQRRRGRFVASLVSFCASTQGRYAS